MIKLLRANLARLWKTKVFWVCVIISFVLSCGNILRNISLDRSCIGVLGNEVLSSNLTVIFIASIFMPLYLGTDHSNGTIRNKLVIGGTRTQIYFSNLITAIAGGLITLAASWFAVLGIGFALGGKIGISADSFWLETVIGVCAVSAMCAIFTLIGTLISKKSITTTITLVSTFALIVGASWILSRLNEQEYYNGLEIIENGSIVVDETQTVRNPDYINGAARDILTAVNDVLPTGQMTQMQTGEPHNVKLMPLYSFGVLTVTTAAGVAVFRKKDLK